MCVWGGGGGGGDWSACWIKDIGLVAVIDGSILPQDNVQY